MRGSPRPGILMLSFAALAFVAAVRWPLWTYALTLATFGIVHVAVELRYVDERFGPRVPGRLAAAVLWLLGVIVLLRLLALGAVVGHETQARGELLLVSLLVLAVLPTLLRAGPIRATIGLTVLGLVVWGALAAPLLLLVVFAVAHNLTPLGFVADALEGRARRTALFAGLVLFLAVPALIASGAPASWIGQATSEGAASFAGGGLDAHLGAFVPGPLLRHPRAFDFFRAAVYLQCMHYAAVVYLLPRLRPRPRARRERLPWPAPRVFAGVLVAAGLLSLAAFAWAFEDARVVYGLFALFHAWIEIPLLLLALVLRPVP